MSSEKSVILITGAGGWVGSLLAEALLGDSETPNLHLILVDIIEPKIPKNAEARMLSLKADLTDSKAVDSLFETEYGVPDTVYALHGIMSRGSEDDFDTGIKVNVDSIRLLIEATRRHGAAVGRLIKFIFTSSLAVYGGKIPKIVTPETIATPESAYGAGKLVSEIILNEYSRRGLVDGRIFRLPTLIIRPGKPAAATSAFFSGIIREPLSGVEAICPIGDSPDSKELDLEAWLASAETTVRNLVIGKSIPAERFLAHTRTVCLPGFTATVRDELAALKEVAGEEILKLIRFEDNPVNRRIVSSWPSRFDLTYPLSLGFEADEGGMVPIVERFMKSLKVKETRG